MADPDSRLQAVILHNKLFRHSPEDMKDILVQADRIRQWLSDLGFVVKIVALDPEDPGLVKKLTEGVDFVFNLIDSSRDEPGIIHWAAAMLENLGVPFSGASVETQLVTTDKVLTKIRLRHAGILTPDWITLEDTRAFQPDIRWIVKPIREDASVGISQDAVCVPNSLDDLTDRIRRKAEVLGVPCFAEVFVEGGEYDALMLVTSGGEVEALQPIELVFNGFREAGLHEIYSYEGKWGDGAGDDEYGKVDCRLMPEGELSRRIQALGLQVWSLFDMRGYGKVDVRVMPDGAIQVIEINCNPSLNAFRPHARAGLIAPVEVIRRIVSAAGTALPAAGEMLEAVGVPEAGSANGVAAVTIGATPGDTTSGDADIRMGPVAVRKIPGKDRGIVALADFSPGDLIECCPLLVFKSDKTQLEQSGLNRYYYEWINKTQAIVLGYGSLYNHAYDANACYEHDYDNLLLRILAVRPVAAGEEITINYNYYLGDHDPVGFNVV